MCDRKLLISNMNEEIINEEQNIVILIAKIILDFKYYICMSYRVNNKYQNENNDYYHVFYIVFIPSS